MSKKSVYFVIQIMLEKMEKEIIDKDTFVYHVGSFSKTKNVL